MKPLFAVFPLALAVFASSPAADAPPALDAADAKPVASKITAVTVYADRAQVTRVAEVTLPADSTRLAFAKLPGWVDEGSVRVSLAPAEAGQILDVQVQRNYLVRATDQDFQNAETAVREISDRIGELDDEKAVLDAQTRQVESIRVFSLEKLPKDVATREIKPDEYGQSVDFIGSTLRKIITARRDLEKKRRDLQPELNARQRKLDELRQRAQLDQRTVVVMINGAGQSAKLSLTYLLPGATWEPVHELRTAGDSQSVSLASFAVVMQTTGEDWTGVALALSTQKSTETMKIPELEAMLVGGRKLPRLFAAGRDTFSEANKNWETQNKSWFDLANPSAVMQQEFRANLALQLDNVKRVERIFETVKQRGTTAHFAGQGAQTVRSDGRSVRVPIGQATLRATPRIIAAPERSLNAARTVELTNTTGQPLLPSRVALFVEGAFLGLTETEFVGPGEGFPLFLGVADQVKLARTLDKKRSELKRSGTKTKMQVSFLVTVENLSDQPVALQLADRVPVSETEDVRVSSVKIQPEIKPDVKGLLHWDVNVAAKQTKEFRIEYAIEYPNSLPLPADASKRATTIPGKATPPAAESSSPAIYDHIRSMEKMF